MRPIFWGAWLLAVAVAGCTAGHPVTTAPPHAVGGAGVRPEAPGGEPLERAMKLVADKNWPRATAALEAVIESMSFRVRPADDQFRILRTAALVCLEHGKPKLGLAYLGRAVAMPQAAFEDWAAQLAYAAKLGFEADAVRTLTLMAQRYPERLASLPSDAISEIVRKATDRSRSERLALLLALYHAQWRLQWNLEPSDSWRDLALLLEEQGRVAEAADVATHVTNVYVLIGMRSDRRFDGVAAQHPELFDIAAASDREMSRLQAAADATPRSLQLQCSVILGLLSRQHYEAALAAADSLLADIDSTNYPEKLFEDYHDERAWLLDLRAVALERVGRWDEAVEQLTAASRLFEKYGSNVSELIDLGDLYCSLGRPGDALAALAAINAPTSAFGAMQVEFVRLRAAEQRGDSPQVAQSLRFMRRHAKDAPTAYLDALFVVNRPEAAAREWIRQLLDRDLRQEALVAAQSYAAAPGTPDEALLDARRRAVMQRPDVQAAIQRVGRTAAYRLESVDDY